MQGNGQYIVAREGWPLLLIILALVFVSKIYLGWIPSLFFFIIFVTTVYILRNPERTVPSAPLAIVSPCSGRLQSVETVKEEWLSRSALKMRLRISLWDTHSLVSPIEGKIRNQWAEEMDNAEFNRRYTYWIQTDEGDDVLLSLLLGRWSPFTRLFMCSGERIGQGQYCGFLYCTGVVELYIPLTSRIDIKVGDKVQTGSDVLGRFSHEDGISMIGK